MTMAIAAYDVARFNKPQLRDRFQQAPRYICHRSDNQEKTDVND